MNRLSRRKFLGHTGVALAASTQLGLLSRGVQAAADDYCALVCILLAGGADSFNMIVPHDSNRYDAYASARSDLSLPHEELLPLNYAGADGASFAVHPGMPEVQGLFDSGELAFVANIGPLAEPTSRAAFDAGTARLPLGLFSHSDQIAVWQTTAAGERIATGFGGRVADLLQPRFNRGPVSMNISVAGTNLFQTGVTATGYAVDPQEGIRTVAGYDDPENAAFINTLDRLLAHGYDDPFRTTYAAQLRDAIDSGIELNAALDAAPALQAPFTDGGLSSALSQVARIIAARDLLGVQRQTFFVTIGGWDHHDEVLDNQARMLPGISRGLAEFNTALNEMGVNNQVTTFTISDFGRTLTSNGRGSDHGWGGNNLVMGGALNGGQIFGDYPDLNLGTDLDLGRGRFLPTTSTDVFYADLALWFGVAPGELQQVLPNINRFYDAQSSPPPLGLFG